jgi:hypothetical protein
LALIGTIAINMKVNAKQFASGMGAIRKDLHGFATSVQAAGFALLGFGALASLTIGKTVLAASNLEEQADRTRDQFGKYTGQVLDFAKALGTGYGIAKTETLKAASGFSSILEGAGYADDAVAKLAIHLVKLGTDTSRQVNMPILEALQKLHSGLAGMTRPLDDLGISVRETDIDAYAAAHSIKGLAGELSNTQKVQVRLALITERLAKAQENLAKTGDKTAGAIEGVKGRFENLSATIGETFLVVAASGLGDLQVGLQALQTAWIDTATAAVGSSDRTIQGLGEVHTTIGAVQTSIGNIANAFQLMGQGFRVVQGGINAGIWSIVSTLAVLEEGLLKFYNSMQFGPFGRAKVDTKNTFLGAMADNLKIELAKMQKEVAAAQAAPWASEVINAAFAKGRLDIQAARDKLKAMGNLTPAQILAIPQKNAIAAGGHEHKGFAHAAVLGSPEAANALLQSRFGMAGIGGPAEKTANNTARTNVLLEKILARRGAKEAAIAGAFFDAF